jgi:hypothetical protein
MGIGMEVFACNSVQAIYLKPQHQIIHIGDSKQRGKLLMLETRQSA